MRREVTPEQIAARTAEGLARMATDEKSTKRPNQHSRPRRRAGRFLRGMSFERLGNLSQESLQRYTFDGNALRRKAKPERRKKTRRDVRAGRKPYQRPAQVGPKPPAAARERGTDAKATAESRKSLVRAAMRDLGLTGPITRLGRAWIAKAVGSMSLGAVQDAVFSLRAAPFTRVSRKGNRNLPRRKQAWLHSEILKKRRAAEIQGWPKDEKLPRRLRKVLSQRRKVREAFNAR